MKQTTKEINNSAKVLIVEDDNALREAIVSTLTENGIQITEASSASAALTLLKEDFNLVLSDIKMDDMDGIELLKRIRAMRPFLPVLLMTAHGTIEQAVMAMQLGAIDYIKKPFDYKELLEKINTYQYVDASNQDEFIVASPNMIALKEQAKKVATSDINVLIKGENGTGKEIMARFIHQNSERKDKAFIAINCAAIPEAMLEATLFGYEKGAFTGAIKSMAGKFEIANGGSIFLDEIAEIPVNLQVKLLRVIQEKQVERLGSNKVISLDVRIISASNLDFSEAIANKNFREDLYHRINGFPIQIPSLRERLEDFTVFVDFFINRHKKQAQKVEISEKAMTKLKSHVWTGNIRELENVIQRSLVLCNGDKIDEDAVVF